MLSSLVSLVALTARLAAHAQADAAAEIRSLEDAMMSAAARGSKAYMSFYAEDAVELPDGVPAIVGKAAIAKSMVFMDDKRNKLTWSPDRVDVAKSLDLAYSYGTYEFRTETPDGAPTASRGKYATVWKKQSDGSWKVVLDVGNSTASNSEH